MNVGDSRAYVIERRKAAPDQRGSLLRGGNAPPGPHQPRRDARTHPQKNLITRAVGVDATVDGDLFEHDACANGDILLLCSDGLTGMVEDDRKIGRDASGAGTLEACGPTRC